MSRAKKASTPSRPFEAWGDLRGAFAAQEWVEVARLMDEPQKGARCGSDDERAREWAFSHLMGLAPERRPFRLVVGTRSVARPPLQNIDSADLTTQHHRLSFYGPNLVLGPLYGYTWAHYPPRIWSTDWETEPAPLRKPLRLARAQALYALLEHGRAHQLHGFNVAALRQLWQLALTTADNSDALLDNLSTMFAPEKSFRWARSEPGLAELRRRAEPVVGAEAVILCAEFNAAYMARLTPSCVQVLIQWGRLRQLLVDEAGAWPVPSPMVGGAPLMIKPERTQQVLPTLPLFGGGEA